MALVNGWAKLFTVISSISSGCILILLWNFSVSQSTLVGVIVGCTSWLNMGSGFKVQVFTCQCILWRLAKCCFDWFLFDMIIV